MPDLPIRIARGDRGDAVRDVQQRLGSLGYTIAHDELAGRLGPSTEEAVRAFQTDRGLLVDGVVGRQTWSALVESGYRLGDRLLYHRQPMLRGDDVAELQRALNSLGFDAGKEDGIFGEDTRSALREFQRNAGVPVDGISGPATLEALARLGQPRAGSVARVRDRESMRQLPQRLAGRRIFLTVAPELEALGEVVRRGLLDHRATVVVEPATDDQSELATEANRFEADLVVLLRLAAEGRTACAFYESGAFRSERGHHAASRILEELDGVVASGLGEPVGRTYALLRETRAPAVVVEPAAADPEDVGRLVTHAAAVGLAVVEGIRRWAEDPLDD